MWWADQGGSTSPKAGSGFSPQAGRPEEFSSAPWVPRLIPAPGAPHGMCGVGSGGGSGRAQLHARTSFSPEVRRGAFRDEAGRVARVEPTAPRRGSPCRVCRRTPRCLVPRGHRLDLRPAASLRALRSTSHLRGTVVYTLLRRPARTRPAGVYVHDLSRVFVHGSVLSVCHRAPCRRQAKQTNCLGC